MIKNISPSTNNPFLGASPPKRSIVSVASGLGDDLSNALRLTNSLPMSPKRDASSHGLHTPQQRTSMANLPLRGTPQLPSFDGPKLLERALAVVQFTPIAKLAEDANPFVGNFQEAIRHQFPIFEPRQDANVRVHLDRDGSISANQENNRTWVFATPDRKKTVLLTSGSLALDMQSEAYTSRSDFVAEMIRLVDALEHSASPSHWVRIGVRLLNTGAVSGDDDPRRFCAPELTSISGQPGLSLADLLWHFEIEEGRMVLRSGMMPQGASYDPAFFADHPQPTWYLDIDVHKGGIHTFDRKIIENSLFSLIDRLHAVYQWAMANNGGNNAAEA